MIQVIKGNFIFTKKKEQFEVHENHYLIIKNGQVVEFFDVLPQKYQPDSLNGVILTDYEEAIIIPSFIDLHIHGPQYMQMGIGLDLQLIDWLNQYTFISEQRFSEVSFAEKVYPAFVDALYRNGSLRSVIYGTIHDGSNSILVNELKKRGLIAYVGKVNMDRNAPGELLQTADESIRETKAFIEGLKGDQRVRPIITPRFAPSCTPELLQGLGELSKEYHVPIQSHLAENMGEIQWVKELFPTSDSYSSVYVDFGLYGEEKTLMAHAIHLSEDELQMAKHPNIFLVHCPNSNFNLSSGIMPVTKYLDKGIQIGMGSDVGAGHRIGMNHTITAAIQGSKILHVMHPESRILTESESFYLATKGNGRFFGNVGSFEEGYRFDALVIKDSNPIIQDLNPLEQLQRFLYCGSSESIVARYLEGKKI